MYKRRVRARTASTTGNRDNRIAESHCRATTAAATAHPERSKAAAPCRHIDWLRSIRVECDGKLRTAAAYGT